MMILIITLKRGVLITAKKKMLYSKCLYECMKSMIAAIRRNEINSDHDRARSFQRREMKVGRELGQRTIEYRYCM